MSGVGCLMQQMEQYREAGKAELPYLALRLLDTGRKTPRSPPFVSCPVLASPASRARRQLMMTCCWRCAGLRSEVAAKVIWAPARS